MADITSLIEQLIELEQCIKEWNKLKPNVISVEKQYPSTESK